MFWDEDIDFMVGKKAAKQGRRAPQSPGNEEALSSMEGETKRKSSGPILTRRTGGWAEETTKSAKGKHSSSNSIEDERFQATKSVDSDDDIPVIPDIEELQDEIYTLQEIQAPSVSVNKSTYKELDSELIHLQKNQTTFGKFTDLNLSFLTNKLMPEKEVQDPDVVWSMDMLADKVLHSAASPTDGGLICLLQSPIREWTLDRPITIIVFRIVNFDVSEGKMDRFEYTSSVSHAPNEVFLSRYKNIRLYDGDVKTSFFGELTLTTHRIFFGKAGDFNRGEVCIAMPLSLIRHIEEESPASFSFGRSTRKVVLHLSEPDPNRFEGPQAKSDFNYIKLGFKDGPTRDAYDLIFDAIQKKKWVEETAVKQVDSNKKFTIELRTGIGGIEKALAKKQNATEENMQLAFQDLSVLMTKAKDMVRLADQISNKIKEKTGDISEDETVRFKSYLLSLGIETPVTRDAYKSETLYFENLAKQVVEIVQNPVEEAGGMMTLFDVYCRVNRARGMEVISPMELLNSCKMMEGLNLPLKLHQFDSGVTVLQLQTLFSEDVAAEIGLLVEENGSISPEELAQNLGISILLAKERLLWAEQYGKTCRDDSIEGLRFYPNLFLTKEE